MLRLLYGFPYGTSPFYSLLPALALSPLTAPQPHCLPVLLQFRNQPVPLLHHIGILLVLIVRSVCLDDAIDPINRAWYAVCRDEFGQVPSNRVSRVRAINGLKKELLQDIPIEEIHRHAKVLCHAPQSHDSIALEQLLISS